MSGKLHWELGRPAARKRPQESDEAVVASRRVMTAERRASTCKRKRLEQASEGRLVSKKPVTEEEMREIAARQRLPAFPHLALAMERLSVKVLPMTPVSHGKPCAGNPHARFEEGASTPLPKDSEVDCSTPQQSQLCLQVCKLLLSNLIMRVRRRVGKTYLARG